MAVSMATKEDDVTGTTDEANILQFWQGGVDVKTLHVQERIFVRQMPAVTELLQLLARARETGGSGPLTGAEERALALLQTVPSSNRDVHSTLLQVGREAEHYIMLFMPHQAVAFYEGLVNVCRLRNKMQQDQRTVREKEWKFDLAAAMSSHAYAQQEVGGASHEKSVVVYTEVCNLLRAHGNTKEVAWMCNHLMWLNMNNKVLNKSYMDETETYLDLTMNVPWSWKAAVLTSLGYAAVHQRDFKKARQVLDEALRVRKHNCPDHHSVAVSYSARGYMYRMEGNKAEAIRNYSEAIRLYEAQRAKWKCSSRSYSMALYHKGRLLDWNSHPDEAENCLRNAIDLMTTFRRLFSHTALFIRTFASFLMQVRGNFEEAAARYEEALGIYQHPQAGGDFLDAYYTAVKLLHALARTENISKGVEALARILDMQRHKFCSTSILVNSGTKLLTAVDCFLQSLLEAPDILINRQDSAVAKVKSIALKMGRDRGLKGIATDVSDRDFLIFCVQVVQMGECYLLAERNREKGNEDEESRLRQTFYTLRQEFNDN